PAADGQDAGEAAAVPAGPCSPDERFGGPRHPAAAAEPGAGRAVEHREPTAVRTDDGEDVEVTLEGKNRAQERADLVCPVVLGGGRHAALVGGEVRRLEDVELA